MGLGFVSKFADYSWFSWDAVRTSSERQDAKETAVTHRRYNGRKGQTAERAASPRYSRLPVGATLRTPAPSPDRHSVTTAGSIDLFWVSACHRPRHKVVTAIGKA